MTEPNPYAPPATDGLEGPPKKKTGKRKTASKELRVWREGDCVVMDKDEARLPKRCVVCNAPIVGERVARQFVWHPPWVYATMVCGWLPYMLLASSMRKGAKVELGLCAVHHERRRDGLRIAWIGGAAALLLLIFGAVSHTTPLLMLGLLLMIVLPFAGGRMARVAYPARINDVQIWLKVGEPFLASIPERDD
jgi:hypothetical protein